MLHRKGKRKMKKAKKILRYLFVAVSTVGMMIWSWRLWADFFNPAIVAFGPAQPALTRLRMEIGKRAISGVVLFVLWVASIFTLSQGIKKDKEEPLPKHSLEG